jgi:4-hydroxy-3-polyprenylbenzoate decarboxylase
MMDSDKQIIVAMTGASGAAYGLRLMQRLAAGGVHQHVLMSDAARVVLRQEKGVSLPAQPAKAAQTLACALDIPEDAFSFYKLDDWFSPAASGSAGIRQMVIIPCSMGSLARIATGASGNLIERAADVIIKEGKSLILVPRETPLSSIHLEHMLKLSRIGVQIIPAMPGFYRKPRTVDELVDFIVDRVLDHLGIEDRSMARWPEA